MTAPMKGWNAVVASTVNDVATEDFNRETEVQAKLIAKPSREYIYELLTKMRFPLIKIEAIIERRGNTVDFTCKDRISAESLQRLLDKHPNVREARLFESEFIDVKLTGVPHRLPDGKIIAFLNKGNGEVLCTKRLKDRKGYFDGRRIYRMRTAELQRKPIPQLIRISECSIRIDYYGQPTRCYLCKKFGHMKHECPEAVTTPPMYLFDNDSAILKTVTHNEQQQQDTSTPVTNASTPTPHEAQHPQATQDKMPLCVEATSIQEALGSRQREEKEDQMQTNEGPEHDNSEFSPSSSEAEEIPDQSVFESDEENTEPGKKPQHSPDTVTEKKPKPSDNGETFECECGGCRFNSFQNSIMY